MNKPIKEYLDYLTYERNYSPQTVKSTQYDLEKFFKFLGEEFQNSLIQIPKPTDNSLSKLLIRY